MKNIPLSLRQAKNQFGQDSPWLFLLDLKLDETTIYNLVANTEDIQFQGKTYTAFPFKVDLPEEDKGGQIPTINLMVSNVLRVLQGQMEALGGGVGADVTLYIVNAGLLAENYAEFTMEFQVLTSYCTTQWVTFTLGIASPLRRRFPLYRYLAYSCKWAYKSCECNYQNDGDGLNKPTCKRTFQDCIDHGNTANFGGEPGLAPGGIRFA